jgi:hypothetical protein
VTILATGTGAAPNPKPIAICAATSPASTFSRVPVPISAPAWTPPALSAVRTKGAPARTAA